jgi:hypothetical protein
VSPHFRAWAWLEPPLELTFTVRTAAFSGGGRRRGIQFRDDDFDALFVVESPDEPRLRAVLDAPLRRQISGALKGGLAYSGSVECDGKSVTLEHPYVPSEAKMREALDAMVALAEAIGATAA